MNLIGSHSNYLHDQDWSSSFGLPYFYFVNVLYDFYTKNTGNRQCSWSYLLIRVLLVHPEAPRDLLDREVPRHPAGRRPLFPQWYLEINHSENATKECSLLLSRNILITLSDDRCNDYKNDRILYVHYCLNELQWRTILVTFI